MIGSFCITVFSSLLSSIIGGIIVVLISTKIKDCRNRTKLLKGLKSEFQLNIKPGIGNGQKPFKTNYLERILELEEFQNNSQFREIFEMVHCPKKPGNVKGLMKEILDKKIIENYLSDKKSSFCRLFTFFSSS